VVVVEEEEFEEGRLRACSSPQQSMAEDDGSESGRRRGWEGWRHVGSSVAVPSDYV